jgi:hypothetical protein
MLTDNFFPAGEDGCLSAMKGKYDNIPYAERPIRAHVMCGRGKADQSIPKAYGIPLVLYAIRNGVKNVAVVSDGNHHTDMESALLFDDWSRAFHTKSKHTGTSLIGGTRVTVGGCENGKPKDWGYVLQKLHEQTDDK